MRPVLLTLLLAVATPALAAPPAVKACVNLRNVGTTRIADDRTIYYRENRQWYRNDIPGGCAGMRPWSAIASRTPSTQLCRGDIITVFEPSSQIPQGSCGLGDFTPVDKPPEKAR